MAQNLKAYDGQASALSAAYNSLTTPDILPELAKHIQSLTYRSSSRVLDLGCVSGRDAFWIAQQGVPVIAVDGAPAMLTEARALHNHPLIDYIQDEAPTLRNLTARHLKFDTVLMSAFLFHFDAAERQELYNNLKPLLRDKARLFITLRHGPVPEGRVMHPVPLQELEDFAKQNGGASVYCGQKPDPLKRPHVCWDHVTLRLGS